MLDGLFQPIHLLLITIMGFVVLIPFWRIFKKAGFSPWLSLLTMIPSWFVRALLCRFRKMARKMKVADYRFIDPEEDARRAGHRAGSGRTPKTLKYYLRSAKSLAVPCMDSPSSRS